MTLDFLEHPNPTYPSSTVSTSIVLLSIIVFLALRSCVEAQCRVSWVLIANYYHLVIDMKAQPTFLSIVASADEYVPRT